MLEDDEVRGTGGSQVLRKGLRVLAAIGEYPDGVGVSELARRVHMPTSTVHRLASTLVDEKFVAFNADQRQYTLGIRVFELSHSVTRTQAISDVAAPLMQRLVEETGETCLLSLLDRNQVLYVAQVPGTRRVRVSAEIGSRVPLYCTAQGKVLLASLPDDELDAVLAGLNLERRARRTITDLTRLREELSRVRSRGYATANEEHEDGIGAVSVPVTDPLRRTTAALCISAPVLRSVQQRLDEYVPLLKRAAHEIERSITMVSNLSPR